jgi:hypothetical protein
MNPWEKPIVVTSEPVYKAPAALDVVKNATLPELPKYSSPGPTIGRILHYRLSKSDADFVNEKRALSGQNQHMPTHGAQAHSGNGVSEGQIFPLIVTMSWPEEYPEGKLGRFDGTRVDLESHCGVNGQLFLDGNDSLWIRSAPQHRMEAGCWFWPPR